MTGNSDSTEKLAQSSPKRRSVLQSVGVGLSTAVGFGGIASAEDATKNERSTTTVETMDVDVDDALQKLDDVIGSPLFKKLVSKGHLSEQSIDEFPAQRLADDSSRGGVTKLRVNGELEQLNFHKEVNGDRLEINLPLSDYEPKATLYQQDGSTKTFHYGNQFEGEEIKNVSTNSAVNPTEECSGFRWCTTCVACCGYDNWSRDEEKVDCPNCWVSDCQWVKLGCC
ncbi:hypothetical protein [Halorussus salinus]|uniref:hypothetical protein n=1 Tax=Halorussus salinus TaxID=1364935 RepID=UPI0010930E35|nr:hypothetical protein [Halorussus salinus]